MATWATGVHVDDTALAAKGPDPAEGVAHAVGEKSRGQAERRVVIDLHGLFKTLDLQTEEGGKQWDNLR